MTNQTQTHQERSEYSALHLAALAVVAVGGLRVVSTCPPLRTTEDFAYTGVLDSEGRKWVVKYPLTDHAGTLLEAETAVASSLLEQLRAGNLPFDVMRPEGYAAYKGRRAVIYPAPLGVAKDFAALTGAEARELGRAIAAIHSMPAVTLSSAGLASYNSEQVRERLLTELEDASAESYVPAIVRRRWLNAFDDDELWQFTSVAVHGDPAAENFLWAEGAIRSTIGFGEAHVGDPAVDIAPIMAELSEAAFADFFESYQGAMRGGCDEHLLERSALMGEFALVRWLMHGVLTDDQEIIDDATVMLEQLAVEIDADPELSPGPAWHIDEAEPVADSTSTEFNFTDGEPLDSYSADWAESGDMDVSSGSEVPTALTADLSFTADLAQNP